MYSELVESAWRCVREENFDRAHELLEAGLPELRGWEWHFVKAQLDARPGHALRSPGRAAIVEIAVHEPSQLAACVVEDGSIEIRNLVDGETSHVIASDGRAHAVEFSSDGNWLIVGTVDGGQLLVYRTSDWACVTSLPLSLGGIYDVAISEDGGRFAVCSGGAWIQLFEMDSRKSLQKWHLPARMSSIVLSQDGSEAFGAGLDGQLYHVSVGDADYQHWFVADSSLTGIDWLDDQRVCLLTSDAAVSIDIRDPSANPRELGRCKGIATTLDIGPRNRVAVGGGDGVLSLLANGDSPFKQLAHFGSAVQALRWLNGGNEVLVSLSDGRLLRFAVGGGRAPLQFAGLQLVAGALLPKSGIVIGLGDDGWMRAVKLDTGMPVFEKQIHEKSAWAIAVDRDERIVATVGEDRRLCCWELPEWKLRFAAEIDWGVRDVCVAPDGSWIAAAPPLAGKLGDQEGIIGIWDTQHGECRRRLAGHSNWVLRMASTPDSRRLVSASEDRSIRIWSVDTGEVRAIMAPRERAAAQHLALDAAGETLYVGHRDGEVTTWNMHDATAGPAWSAFGDALSGLAVTPDDRLLATSRSDPRLKVWDRAQNKLVASLDLGVGYVLDFQLFDDGGYLSAMGQDGTTFVRLPGHSQEWGN